MNASSSLLFPQSSIKFSISYFGADTYDSKSKYELYLRSAEFADSHGFEAVWTPERHFHKFGTLYPNPSVLSAALATVTKNVKLRAGSVVLPLQDPIRVAEEWAVVDNLSGGRVGMAVATGWHPRDFVLAPGNYADRKKIAMERIQTLKRLWMGDRLKLVDGLGDASEIEIYPSPIQRELPLWITVSGDPASFAFAGSIGANVLTHLLGKTIEQLGESIAFYRNTLAENGHDPRSRTVTLSVHSYLGEDLKAVRDQARVPFMNYMRSFLSLMAPGSQRDTKPTEKTAQFDIDKVVQFAFERYSRTAALIGTPESCVEIVNKIRAIDVNEIACLIDWMDPNSALNGLEPLYALTELARKHA